MPKLDEQERGSLEASITVGEIEKAIDDLSSGKAIDDLSSGKTPGPDGLNAEFYKVFKTELSFFLKQVFDEAYEKHVRPVSFKQSHSILIPKYEEAVKLLTVKSYRPISLTNVDYKIYMKVLASRLQSVIQQLVRPHQTCGIKGRTICTNTQVARTILECCDAFDGHIALLQLDLEKALDRVSHEVLNAVLEHTNVRKILHDGLKMAYANCTTHIVVNKELSEKIEVRCSVRQCCPLSPLLFALYLEPFCLTIY